MPLIMRSDDPRVIVVSSGGMLTNKLSLDDLQSEKMKPFDGTMVYAQNKRQQVIMTHKYAKKYPKIFFASMHPGKQKMFREYVCVYYECLNIFRLGRHSSRSVGHAGLLPEDEE